MKTLTEYERGHALGTPDVTIRCYRCGVGFKIPRALYEVRLADHADFWCPLGHSQCYPSGKTQMEIERERAERAERWLSARQADLAAERASHAATKGQLTKARKRAANGVCPCCSRSFVDVARHVKTKHPEHVAEVGS